MRKDRRRDRWRPGSPPRPRLGVVGIAGGALAQDTTLRVAMGSPGEAGIRVWEDDRGAVRGRHTRASTSRWTTRRTTSTRRSASRTLLAGPNAPDIYFEWTGSRMAQRHRGRLRGRPHRVRSRGPLAGICGRQRAGRRRPIDGKVVLVPHTADVTNVLWYNVPLLAEHGVTPPTTWEELLAACDTLIAAGVIPDRDRQQGPAGPAGNWLSHLASRVVGEDVYRRHARRRRASSRRPSGSRRSATSRSCDEHECVNESANAIDDNEGAAAVLPGRGRHAPDRLVAGQLGDRRGPGPRVRLRQPAGDARGLGRRPGQRHRRRDRLHGQRQQPEHRPRDRVPGARSTAPRTSSSSSRRRSRRSRCPSADAEVDEPVRCAWSSCSTTRPAIVLPPGHGLRPRDRRTRCTRPRPPSSAASPRPRTRSPQIDDRSAASDATGPVARRRRAATGPPSRPTRDR